MGNELASFVVEMSTVFSCRAVWALLPLIMACTYGKDFGKLVVVKRGNALLAKVLTLLFPVVTWAISLTAFLISAGLFGEGFDASSGWLRLAGFAVIAVASISFVRQKKGIEFLFSCCVHHANSNCKSHVCDGSHSADKRGELPRSQDWGAFVFF